MEETARYVTQRNGWAWCGLAAVLFGAATPTTKLIVDNVGAVTLAGLLYIGAGSVNLMLGTDTATDQSRPTATLTKVVNRPRPTRPCPVDDGTVNVR